MKSKRRVLGAIASLVLLTSAASADLLTSQRMQREITEAGDLQGEVIELQTKDGPFLAIHRPRQRGPARGGIVLLHDRLNNADSEEAIRPLRLGLAEAGWDTLSLQLAVEPRSTVAGQDTDGVSAMRLDAGMAWLKARDIDKLVLLAQGDRASLALQWATAQRTQELRALILLSAPLAPPSDDLRNSLRALDLPVLDIYAERDYPPVLATAPNRSMLGTDNPAYRQRALAEAPGGFFGAEQELIDSIRAWLTAHVK